MAGFRNALLAPQAPAPTLTPVNTEASLLDKVNHPIVAATGNKWEITPKDLVYDPAEYLVRNAKTLAGRIGNTLTRAVPLAETSAKVFGGVHGSILSDMLIPMTAHAGPASADIVKQPVAPTNPMLAANSTTPSMIGKAPVLPPPTPAMIPRQVLISAADQPGVNPGYTRRFAQNVK